MFTASQSQTPVPSAAPYHEKLAETVTWVRDWYTPDLSSTSDNVPSLIKIKGWFKTNINHKAATSLKLSQDDVLDLSKWKYLPPPPPVEIKEPEPVETTATTELKDALITKDDEGEINGLG